MKRGAAQPALPPDAASLRSAAQVKREPLGGGVCMMTNHEEKIRLTEKQETLFDFSLL